MKLQAQLIDSQKTLKPCYFHFTLLFEFWLLFFELN